MAGQQLEIQIGRSKYRGLGLRAIHVVAHVPEVGPVEIKADPRHKRRFRVPLPVTQVLITEHPALSKPPPPNRWIKYEVEVRDTRVWVDRAPVRKGLQYDAETIGSRRVTFSLAE